MSDTPQPPSILTPRFRLRPVAPSDCGWITEAVADPRIHRMLARVAPGQTKAQTLAWIMTHDRGRAEDTDHVFAIETDGGPAGIIGAHRTATDLPFEIGYWMAPTAWGNGLCTEGARGLIGWLEAARGVRVLVSGYFADNPASGRILAKLGFLPCGRGPKLSLGRGEMADHVQTVRVNA
jgi:RimJ/RimL family protein N-acetyltransferase